MPDVPVYERSIQPGPLPGVRLSPAASPAAFGAGAGEGLQAIGAEAGKIHQEETLKANQIAVMDAASQLGQFHNDLLYNPETGALNTKGKNSFGVYDPAKQSFDQKAAEIEAGLGNQEQKNAFRSYALRTWNQTDAVLQRHISGQRLTYDTEATSAYVATERQNAIDSGDTSLVAPSIAAQGEALAKLAARNGLPPEWLQQKTAEASSKTHLGVLERMLANGQDLSASDYLKANRAGFSGADLIMAEKAVQTGSYLGESQRRTDEILSANADMGSALEQAKSIADPKVRDLVETRITHKFTRDQEVKRLQDQGTNDAFMRKLLEPQTYGPLTIGQIATSNLPRTDKEFYAKALTNPPAARTDPKAWIPLDDSVTSLTPDAPQNVKDAIRAQIQESMVPAAGQTLPAVSFEDGKALLDKFRKNTEIGKTENDWGFKEAAAFMKAKLGWQGGIVGTFLTPDGPDKYFSALMQLRNWADSNKEKAAQDPTLLLQKAREIALPLAADSLRQSLFGTPKPGNPGAPGAPTSAAPLVAPGIPFTGVPPAPGKPGNAPNLSPAGRSSQAPLGGPPSVPGPSGAEAAPSGGLPAGLPDPKAFSGKFAVDPATGTTFKSDGVKWTRVR